VQLRVGYTTVPVLAGPLVPWAPCRCSIRGGQFLHYRTVGRLLVCGALQVFQTTAHKPVDYVGNGTHEQG